MLVVEGASDPVIPTSSTRGLFARHPAWDHVALPGVGHVPQLEDPDAFAAALSPWLARTAEPVSGRRS